MKRSIFTILFLIIFSALISPLHAAPTSLRILYVNDFHGYAEPYKAKGDGPLQGGIAYLAARVNQLRREKPTLLLAAGDMIRGNTWANLFQGFSVIELMNAMKFDAMVVGNHEFDYGPKVLKEIIARARFPVLGANVAGLPALKPYVIKSVAGVRVGIIGLVTPETPELANPKDVQGLKFASPEATARKYLHQLRNQAEVIIILSHLGYPEDRALAEKVPGIDVIVGGHTHTKLDKPARVNDTIIVQAWEYGKVLGVLDLTRKAGKISLAKGYLEAIQPEPGQDDPAVSRIVAKYQQKMDGVLQQVVGETDVDLDADHARSRETNFGDLVTDIIRQKTGAEVALINGGTLRRSLVKGVIRQQDLYSALPFDNYLVVLKLTGGQIKEALEHGVSGVAEKAGRFPQVSGLTFTYNPAAPVGSRVKEVIIGGQPLKPEQEYTLATNDFLAAGGDKYTVFVELLKGDAAPQAQVKMGKGGKVMYSQPGKQLREVVADFLQAQGKVAPALEGRIKEVR
ncbi:MAG: 5'-nucleotidase C-terminal domain-containing protein [Thermodesulfobacteriota bacterium]